MTYKELKDWTNLHDLILNRVQVINDMHGCKYPQNVANPCKVKYHGGWYSVYYCGSLIGAWKMYEMNSTMRTYRTVDLLQDCLWNGRRLGYMQLCMG